jgi:acetyl esterase/lipase
VLDPRLQFIAHQAKGSPPMTTLAPGEARAASAGGLAMVAGEPEPGVHWEDLTCELAHGAAPARIYRPDRQDPDVPLLVYLHMGGGVIGDLETHHVFCTMIASIARCAVLSIDYRLAPEHRFPAGLEDSLQAVRWARDHADRFGAPVGRVAVAGDSMGGNFAAVICQDLRASGEPQPELQVLIYPAVDADSATQSMTLHAESYPLTTPMMRWFMLHYMAEGQTADDVRVSPIRAANLSGLAPAIVVTAGFDPLSDQGEAYAHRLKEAGVPALHRRYDSLCHGFTAMTGAIPAADTANREIAGLIREAFEGRLTAAL